ncbi:DUF2000 family protein [Streptomyces sp. NPDC004539]|uniref:DUF2000 family protein n=1 Tax=Streptomyces sp. NPDC004539 TaxID=3154280 RepID=UPI0033AE255C
MPEVLRTVIAVDKSLEPGAVANVSAIVMGQLARLEPGIYADDVRDRAGVLHAGIRFNTVVLSGRTGHLAQLVEAASAQGLRPVVFTSEGRTLSNSFDTYRALVTDASPAELGICAVGVTGEDTAVRALTKRFSVYRG